MAEGKRIYEIKINGLEESYEGVKSLREALNTLSDSVVNVSKEEEKVSSSRKSTTTATDQLAKATQKLNEWDRSYQTELALVNKELSDNKKEIKDVIKLQEAQAVVDAKQLDSYRDKQTYLSALNTLIRNHSTATEEDRAAIDAMVQESAQLQAELKATDEQMKIYVRNVGNYPGAAEMVVESHKSLKQELKELKTEMAEMLASGVSKTDEAYLKLAERAGQLKDAMSDANQDITNFASDTRGLTNAVNLATSAVNAYQLYNSALQVFGSENEEAAQSMQKMMAVMTLLNSLQQVQNSLLENGSATARLYSKAVELVQAALGIKKTATEADIAATKASTLAHSDMRKELVDLKAKMVDMVNNGISTSDEAYQQLADRAGQLQDALTNASSATEQNTVANKANAASAESSTVAETANTGVTTANTTAKDANTVATNKMSLAQKAGAVASKTLSVALRAIPLMAIIGLVMALIQNWESIWNWFKKTFPVLDTLSKKFNKFGGLMNAIVTGAKAVAAAVVNWLINPFKTFANVVGKILEGDFSGAWQAALDGVKNQFKGTVDAFKGEIVKGYARGQEEMTRKSAAENEKRLEHHKNMITKQKNADGTYRKEYIKAEQAVFDNKKKMYKKGSDEYNKVLEDEARFHQQVEDAKTAATEKGTKARAAAAKKAAADAKKTADEARKELEEFKKKADEIAKASQKAIEDSDKQISTDRKARLKEQGDSLKKAITESNKTLSEATGHYLKFSKQADEYAAKAEQYKNNAEQFLANGDKQLAESELINAEYWMSMTQNARDYADFYEKQMNEEQKKLMGYTSKRKEIVMNELAYEATEMKTTYLEQNKALTKQIEEEEALLKEYEKRKDDENIKKSKERIGDLKQQLRLATENAKLALGRYFENENIKIPVDFDIDNLLSKFFDVKTKLEEQNIKMPFDFDTLTDMMVEPEKALERFYNKAYNAGATYDEKVQNLKRSFGALAQVINLSDTSVEELWEIIADPKPFLQVKDDLSFILNTGEVSLSKFGTIATKTREEITSVTEFTTEEAKKAYDNFIKEQDKVISTTDKNIKRFQDATRDIKFEPVMEDDVLSKYFEGQILNIDKTKKRYAELKEAYATYKLSITEGSEEMEKVEEAWQQKLNATALKYGENSQEYELMYNDYKSTMKSYVLEREKVSQQIEEIQKKENAVMKDYFESLHKRMSSIYSSLSENVFQPLAEGFGALIDFQLEEAQEALEKITKLYDKAVEAREESAERLKQINDELRADEGQNKEALQQRLAEEEVLLVQREENERALQKEKEKREAEVEKKEKQQRKLELGQKLLEGIANTALGATAALKYGFPLGPVFAAIITAMGALQTAIIAKQISKLEKGGKVGEQGVSRSHKQGGHRIEDTNIEVEGGEWVINRKSSQKYDSLLKSINDDNVGLVQKQVEIIRERRIISNGQPVRFADGGQINTLAATRAVRDNNDIQAITDLIKQIDFEPTVSVVDINRKNKNLVRVQQYAGKAG